MDGRYPFACSNLCWPAYVCASAHLADSWARWRRHSSSFGTSRLINTPCGFSLIEGSFWLWAGTSASLWKAITGLVVIPRWYPKQTSWSSKRHPFASQSSRQLRRSVCSRYRSLFSCCDWVRTSGTLARCGPLLVSLISAGIMFDQKLTCSAVFVCLYSMYVPP